MKKILIIAGLTGALVAVAGASYVLLNRSPKSATTHHEITQIASQYANLSFDTISEWDDTYRIHVSYPVTPDDELNTYVKGHVDTLLGDFRNKLAERTDNSRRPFGLNVSTDIDYATGDVASIVGDERVYTGGDDKVAQYHILVDTVTGKQIPFSSLFKNDDYKNIVKEEALKVLPTQLGAAYNETLASLSVIADASHLNQYQIAEDEKVFVVFQPGEVAAAAQGVIKLPLEIDALEPYFSESGAKLFPKIVAAIEAREAEEKKQQESQQNQPTPLTAPAQKNTGATDCAVRQCIALTFDDGPGAPTAETLDLLAQYNVPATFFYIGRQVASRADIVKRAHDAGHDMGIHTWDHIDMANSDAATVSDQVNRTQQAIVDATGTRASLLRPPYGSFTQANIANTGLSYILWNIDPNDWKDHDADIVYSRVIEKAAPGAIILSHDIHPTTVAAYKRIVPELINRGYTLVTVSDLLNIDLASPPAQAFYSGN